MYYYYSINIYINGSAIARSLLGVNALDSGIHFFHVHLILVEKLTKFFT